MDLQFVPLMSPADLGAVDAGSAFVNVRNAQQVSFIVPLGTITGGTCTITVDKSPDGTAGPHVKTPFMYRLSSAVGTDTWGNPTSASTAGVAVAATDDDKVLLIEIDPASLGDGFSFLRVWLDLAGSTTACEAAVIAVLEPRYKQHDPIRSI